MEKMVPKRRRKVKGGQAAAKATVAASEGGQKLLTRYDGKTEENPSNYVLLYVRGKAWAEKNRGDGGSADVGRGGGSAIDYMRN